MGYVLVEKADSLVWVTVNRPESLNALNSEVFSNLYDVFADIDREPGNKVIIVTGQGERAFVAGSDVAEMAKMNFTEARNFAYNAKRMLDKIASCKKPVIAMIKGLALGGGLELALACDLRVCASTAKLGLPELKVGVIPGSGGTQRLARLIGVAKAKELILTGAFINAEEAHQLGMVNRVVSPEKLREETTKLAREIAAHSAVGLAAVKKVIDVGIDLDLDTALLLEIDYFASCFTSLDQKEGMTAFLEKRKPRFSDC